MEKMMAYCGLVCTDCKAYIATQQDDNELRRAVAEEWGKEYNYEFKIEDINCDGCTATGRLVGYCHVCPIRSCGQEKEIENCGWCDSYPCDKLDGMFKAVPDNRERLNAVKQSRS
jgi:hypothetical protein